MMYMTPVPAATSPVRILLIEDNPGDQLLTRKALARTRLEHDLIVISDGRAALDFLFQRGEHADAPRPDLILLDLNLPSVDGPTVLADLKHDPNLRRIPVIILTSSEA
jgi:CheY-like chemotaxis protein